MEKEQNQTIEVRQLGTKLGNIEVLEQLGLSVPPTYIINPQFPNWQEDLQKWLKQHEGFSVQARTSSTTKNQETRYLPSTRNHPPEELLEKLNSQEWQVLVNDPERRVFIQALPPDALNRNLYSFQIMYDPVQQAYVLEIRHDIASTLAREGQTPDERVVIPEQVFKDLSPTQLAEYIQHHRQIVDLETQKRNFRYTLLRFGRSFLKGQGVKVPKLERLDLDARLEELVSELKGFDKEGINNYLTKALDKINQDDIKQALEKLGMELPTELEKLTLRQYLELLGLAELLSTDFEKREYHASYKMLQNFLHSNESVDLYQPPSSQEYKQIMQDAKRLEEAGILKYYIPKASILDTHDLEGLPDVTFYYWDLIKSGYSKDSSEQSKFNLYHPGKYRLLHVAESFPHALYRIAWELYGVPFKELPKETQKFIKKHFIRAGD